MPGPNDVFALALSGSLLPGAITASDWKCLGVPLNERYTFERFVVGPNNQFAVAACRAVAEAPGQAHNPLVIYAGAGLGKTHLLHAIGHAVLARDPGTRIECMTGESYVQEMVAGIQRGELPGSTRRYRAADVLLIDDTHSLCEREGTREEFLHTLRGLDDGRRQIVVVTGPPEEIAQLEGRLRLHFDRALITCIAAPDLHAREAILRQKLDEDRLDLADNVVHFIASTCRKNVRELEGAIVKLLAYSSLTGRKITLELAREALGGVITREDLGSVPALSWPAELSRRMVRALAALFRWRTSG